MDRSPLIQDLGSRILSIKRDHPVRVGIDGVDAAGKTTLADELAPHIEAAGRQMHGEVEVSRYRCPGTSLVSVEISARSGEAGDPVLEVGTASGEIDEGESVFSHDTKL